jgi:hypothetical protein
MPPRLDEYDVTWATPSKDSSGSMPLGNGDIGLNVWVEEGGDVVLLIGKTDAWDENSSLLKLGRVRLKVSPLSLTPFRQTLRLRSGDIVIELGGVRLNVWVDANHPVIVIDAEGESAFEMSASLEIWRTEPRVMEKTQTGDLFKKLGKGEKDPYPTITWPDDILRVSDRVMWCHHNERREHDGFAVNMRLQGLDGFLAKLSHPLLGRTFGGSMQGEGIISCAEKALASNLPRARHRLTITALTLHPSTIDKWRHQIDAIDPRAIDRAAHERWWADFWDRSHLFVTSGTSEARDVTRGYVLQRFMNACAGRGVQPIKFNGSIFSVGREPEGPDFRRWGGPGFWFQNMRLVYWPMLAAGDFDLLAPFVRTYVAMLPLMKHRTRTYYGHGGAHYPETITFWGAEVSAHYGWTPFEQREQPEAECSYVTYYWTGGLELTLMLLNVWDHLQDESFARENLLPIAEAVIAFFDLHYPRDERGKLRIEPGQSLETWHEAVNATPDVAGLRYLIERLLSDTPLTVGDERAARWRRLLAELPPIPVGENDGHPVILPGEHVARKTNKENPELYAVFPFRVFGLGKPDLERARNTFFARLHASHDCWSQDDIHAAFLGLSDVAKEYVSKRASPASHSDSRFPGFWNAFHDWVPDMDHGGVLQLALQSMLMQCEGRQILLLPAWPKEWDVEFKLHAPYRTVVEGKVVGGEIVELHVTPPERKADVVVWKEQMP